MNGNRHKLKEDSMGVKCDASNICNQLFPCHGQFYNKYRNMPVSTTGFKPTKKKLRLNI